MINNNSAEILLSYYVFGDQKTRLPLIDKFGLVKRSVKPVGGLLKFRYRIVQSNQVRSFVITALLCCFWKRKLIYYQNKICMKE